MQSKEWKCQGRENPSLTVNLRKTLSPRAPWRDVVSAPSATRLRESAPVSVKPSRWPRRARFFRNVKIGMDLRPPDFHQYKFGCFQALHFVFYHMYWRAVSKEVSLKMREKPLYLTQSLQRTQSSQFDFSLRTMRPRTILMKTVEWAKDKRISININKTEKLKRRCAMKRFMIGTTAVIVLCLFIVSFAGVASADCPDNKCNCVVDYSNWTKNCGGITIGMCWSWSPPACESCKSAKKLSKKCNEKYKDCCSNSCKVAWCSP